MRPLAAHHDGAPDSGHVRPGLGLRVRGMDRGAHHGHVGGDEVVGDGS